MINLQDYENFCNQVLNLDKKIRYVGVIDHNRTYTKVSEGIKKLLTPQETKESISDAIVRWETRKKLAGKLGEPIYAIAKYKKVIRITIPLNQRGLILVSMEPTGFHEILIDEIVEIKNNYL